MKNIERSEIPNTLDTEGGIPDTILIYTETLTNRLRYTTDLVFRQLLGLQVLLTQNKDQFLESELPKMSYTTQNTELSKVFQKATTLLFETAIVEKSITSDDDFFAFDTKNDDSLFSEFDPLARIFYLVSRYEEYTAPPSVFDPHNRFPAAASLAKKMNFLRQPIVNQYVSVLKKRLISHYPNLKTAKPAYQFQPTLDIDQAWQVRYKGIVRNLGGGLRELLKGDFQKLKHRLDILRGVKSDPFFTFPYIFELHKNNAPVIFWLLGNYARFDKNTPTQNIEFQQLIQQVADKYAVGLHPSYASNDSIEVLNLEKKRLEAILKNSPFTIHHSPLRSRQHFLRLRFPETYRRLLEVGIQEDWSMGYADDIGFRAGIATPFYWFDLENDKATNLKIHPFQVMDVTLQQYLELNPKEAVQQTQELIQATKAVGGTFVTLWHNETLIEMEGWEGWRTVYEQIIELSQSV
jgi:hypothetical protein